MIIKIKNGYHVQVDMTRQELKKRGFKLRTFRYDTQKFSVLLTKEGKKLYKNPAEALLAILIAVITNKRLSYKPICKKVIN